MKGYSEESVLEGLRRDGAYVHDNVIELRQQPGIRVWGRLDFMRQLGWRVQIGKAAK